MDSYNSIDELENIEKISYNMSDEDKHKYDNFIELNRIKELQRQKIEKVDLNILKKIKI